jgi:hypothetical protein
MSDEYTAPTGWEHGSAPQGAKGGYAFLVETEDFSVKLLGEHIKNRPSVFIEMRSRWRSGRSCGRGSHSSAVSPCSAETPEHERGFSRSGLVSSFF